jgi:hypothetical protein
VSAKDPFAKDPFRRMVDIVAGGHAGHRAVWGQNQGSQSRGFDERRFRKALNQYWGPTADSMRVSLAVQDASFVAGVVHMVSESLGLRDEDQRRIAAAVVRRRLLGEPVPSLDDVDYAWQAWWPPPPGDEGRMLFAHFLGTWREWLASSSG